MDDETLLVLAGAGVLLYFLYPALKNVGNVASDITGLAAKTTNVLTHPLSPNVAASALPFSGIPPIRAATTDALQTIKSWGNPDAWFS